MTQHSNLIVPQVFAVRVPRRYQLKLHQPNAPQPSAGFTLIELLVVISIIGILSSLLFANYGAIRERGRDSTRKAAMEQMKNALRLYYNDYQNYPAANAGRVVGCGSEGVTICEWGGSFGSSNVSYMAELPLDPINVDPHVYVYETLGADGFLLSVQLENETDPDAAASQSRCGVSRNQGVFVVCAQ